MKGEIGISEKRLCTSLSMLPRAKVTINNQYEVTWPWCGDDILSDLKIPPREIWTCSSVQSCSKVRWNEPV